ncbi:uncharacterized protein F4812DRAFT_190892 [Daldinia caldariorum]|uniref:uncharacterized protein n=1 Tax=Daldinia caldariorum TaxID=326644 RepID=UPI002008684C|nr:uncharacterized protein F4812DRAFT_190892 [Daldinia caldariorum]KAI1471751.1 hypothetical protein F4812DRAFT_190892 [Daldinia caldariorum]
MVYLGPKAGWPFRNNMCPVPPVHVRLNILLTHTLHTYLRTSTPESLVNMMWPDLFTSLYPLLLPTVLLIACAIGAYGYLFRYVTSRREPRENMDRINVYADYDEVHLDIVAVHGLGAHPYYSWKGKGPLSSSAAGESQGHDDFLKKDFKNVRILSYAYNADWFMDASLSTASQKALTFLRALSEFRKNTKKNPPILFIGHSFGGIIVKHAICFAHSELCFEDVNRNTAGILFLGTPHQGSLVSSFGKIIARHTKLSGSNAMLLKLLSYGSPALLNLKSDFSAAITPRPGQKLLPVYSFYETLPTFYCGVSLGVIVGPQSATLDIGQHISVETDHSGLNKCKAKTDQLYVKISSAIRDVQSCLQQESKPIAEWIMGSKDHAQIYKHQMDHERARGKVRAYGDIGEWLIESPEFKTWSDVEDYTRPIFWLRGGGE